MVMSDKESVPDEMTLGDTPRRIRLKGPIEVVLHQCSACGYVSVHKHNTQRHVDAKCPGATVITDEVELCQRGVATVVTGAVGAGAAVIGGDHNSTTITNVTIVLPVGTQAEKFALSEIFRDPKVMADLGECDPAELPALILEYTKVRDAPRGVKNVRLVGDKVHETRENGVEKAVPRKKYVRDVVRSNLEMCSHMEPRDTVDPDAMRKIRDDNIDEKPFKMGKRGSASRLDVARFLASNDHRSIRKLDAAGHEYVRRVQAEVDYKVDYLG